MEAMDQIPIGGSASGAEPEPEEPDNVVHLPSSQAAEDPARIPIMEPDETVADLAEGEEISWEEAVAADADADADAKPSEATPGAEIAALLEQGIKVGAGLLSAGASAVADALRTTDPDDERSGDERKPDDPTSTIAGAGLGAAVTAARAAASVASSAADAVGPMLSWAANPVLRKDATDTAAEAARLLNGQWKATQAETVAAATAFLTVLVPEITKAVLDQIDLDRIVRERVDVNAIVDRVDLDRLIARLDVDAIVSRVDVDQVADRVDVGAMVDRLDLAAITQDVVDEIDLPAIIRESSGAMASETVQAVRVQGMNADRAVSRVIDQMLRRTDRDLEAPGEPEDD